MRLPQEKGRISNRAQKSSGSWKSQSEVGHCPQPAVQNWRCRSLTHESELPVVRRMQLCQQHTLVSPGDPSNQSCPHISYLPKERTTWQAHMLSDYLTISFLVIQHGKKNVLCKVIEDTVSVRRRLAFLNGPLGAAKIFPSIQVYSNYSIF